MSCDYRKEGCASTGQVIGGKWICLKHMSDEFAALQASHEELVKALSQIQKRALQEYPASIGNQSAWNFVACIATDALANAAKLAPNNGQE